MRIQIGLIWALKLINLDLLLIAGLTQTQILPHNSLGRVSVMYSTVLPVAGLPAPDRAPPRLDSGICTSAYFE